VAKYGTGRLHVTGAVTGYTGGTLLREGTLSLPSPLLPATTDLAVTNGATLNLAFVGKQYVHTLVVDGVQMHGGQYTAARAAWITGTGTLVVTYPPVGTILFVK
jgi:autotransporter-associated beta strand protein